MYHVNMEFIRQKVNNLSKINNLQSFESNEQLVSYTLCDTESLSYIEQTCKVCGPKLFDPLKEKLVFCSSECEKKRENCSNHTLPVQQYKRQDYETKKGIKKKLCLVTERITMSNLIDLLKKSMIDFPRHRFNHYHTKEVFSKCKSNLQHDQILKVQDFSENYTCLVPDEVQSLHWSQTQATLYPVVVYRNDGENTIEEQLVYISDDLHHDCYFVEYVNKQVHQYYHDKGIPISHDIEFNDGCSAQYKSIRAFWLFCKRTTRTDRVFCESSHGKGPSDGVGGVCKSLCASAVAGRKLLIRNASEMFQFLSENHSIDDRPYKKGHISCRKFFYLPKADTTEFRNSFEDQPFKTLKGTRKLHQISTSADLPSNKMHVKKYSCLCSECQNFDYQNCSDFQMFTKYVEPVKVTFRGKSEKGGDESDEIDSEDELEDDSEDIWSESDAVQMVKKGDVVVVRSGDDFNPYYLIYAEDEIKPLDIEFSDGYGHNYLPGQSVLKGYYLEEVKCKSGKLFYKESGKLAMVSSYCVCGIAPEMETFLGKRKGNDCDYYKFSDFVHEILLGLSTGLDA